MGKLDRARSLSVLGAYPQTWDSLVAAIPPAIVKSLTGKELAMLADAIYQHRGESQAIAIQDAINEGFVMDSMGRGYNVVRDGRTVN